MVWVLSALAAVLLLDLAFRAFYIRILMRQFQAQPPFNVAPHSVEPAAEQVSAVTADGLTLRGSLHHGSQSQPRGLVVFCPESSGSHWSAAWYCEGLLHSGFDVLSFDFRGQGDSDSLPGYTPNHWPTHYEVRDIDAVLAFVQSRPDLRQLPLMTMGVSRGSLVALMAAAQHPEVRAVCGEGVYTTDSLLEHFTLRWAQLYLPPLILRVIPMWHLRVTLRMVRWLSAWRRDLQYLVLEPWLPRLGNRPVLLISGERDNYVPPKIMRRIAKRIGSPRCRIFSVPKAKHNQARNVARDEFDQTVEEFFSQVVPEAGKIEQPVVVASVR